MTLAEINCELCVIMQKLWVYKTCGIKCDTEVLLEQAHKYYRYAWLKTNVACGSDYEIDCVIKNMT